MWKGTPECTATKERSSRNLEASVQFNPQTTRNRYCLKHIGSCILLLIPPSFDWKFSGKRINIDNYETFLTQTLCHRNAQRIFHWFLALSFFHATATLNTVAMDHIVLTLVYLLHFPGWIWKTWVRQSTYLCTRRPGSGKPIAYVIFKSDLHS